MRHVSLRATRAGKSTAMLVSGWIARIRSIRAVCSV
jgi:hypothetical protein